MGRIADEAEAKAWRTRAIRAEQRISNVEADQARLMSEASRAVTERDAALARVKLLEDLVREAIGEPDEPWYERAVAALGEP